MVELTRGRVVAVLKAEGVRRPCASRSIDLLKPRIHSLSPVYALTMRKEIRN